MFGKKPGKNFSVRNAPGPVIIFLLIFYCLTNFTHRNWTNDEEPGFVNDEKIWFHPGGWP